MPKTVPIIKSNKLSNEQLQIIKSIDAIANDIDKASTTRFIKVDKSWKPILDKLND